MQYLLTSDHQNVQLSVNIGENKVEFKGHTALIHNHYEHMLFTHLIDDYQNNFGFYS